MSWDDVVLAAESALVTLRAATASNELYARVTADWQPSCARTDAEYAAVDRALKSFLPGEVGTVRVQRTKCGRVRVVTRFSDGGISTEEICSE